MTGTDINSSMVEALCASFLLFAACTDLGTGGLDKHAQAASAKGTDIDGGGVDGTAPGSGVVVMQYRYMPVMFPLLVGVGGLFCCVLAQIAVEHLHSRSCKRLTRGHGERDSSQAGGASGQIQDSGGASPASGSFASFDPIPIPTGRRGYGSVGSSGTTGTCMSVRACVCVMRKFWTVGILGAISLVLRTV